MTIVRPDVYTHAAVADVLARADRARRGDASHLWRRVETLLATADQRTAPVMANVAALVALGDAEDFGITADLTDSLGFENHARLQLQVLRRLDESPEREFSNALFRRLAGADADTVGTAVAGIAHEAATYLLVQDVEVDPPAQARGIRSAEQLAGLVASADIATWAPYVAAIVVAPWGPYVAEIISLAKRSGDAATTAFVERLVQVARDIVERRERRQVAEQVRRLVQTTGLPQREFAARIGTSPSRLSTYVSGKVTPSAAMLLRITRTARALESGLEARVPA